jgi:hypothetical protein
LICQVYNYPNKTQSPFRLTTPDVFAPVPTELSLSLLALRNHQLAPQTYGAFKAKPGSNLPVVQAESVTRDLAPGQKTTGVVSVGSPQGTAPQIYQLNFGTAQDRPLTVEAVL